MQDVSRGLQDVLRRNGMQAHITTDAAGNFQMVVMGHDSPAITYKLNNSQAKSLMEWGSNSLNSRAYRTFVSIVNKDFDVPANQVVAFNAGGMVNIGQYGYRVNNGEYGLGRPYMPLHRGMWGWGGDFLGWRPRYGMNRSIHVLERPDGSLRPGEVVSTRMLSRGGKASSMGFYYKGSPTPQHEATQMDLDSVATNIKMIEAEPRQQGQATPYSEAITSNVYFNNEKWQEVLKSHGIVIRDGGDGAYTIEQQFASTRVNTRYDLTPEEYKLLTAEHLDGKDGVSLDKRIALLNTVFQKDFAQPITKEMLESKDLIAIPWKEESKQEVEAPFIEYERQMAERARQAEEQQRILMEEERIRQDPNAINGKDAALAGMGWFTGEKHGRGLVVGEIRVEKTAGDHYLMSAVINGHVVTHPINQKDYDQFLAVDDKHRLMLFDKVFKEVELKRVHGNAVGDDMYMTVRGNYIEQSVEHSTSAQVDGRQLQDINERKAFYREGRHGREVEVSAIQVEPVQETGKYKMTAVLDGVAVTHEISQKEYDRFLAVDDYQRMKMFSKIFNEVDLKTRPGMGTNVGAAILAALVVGTETLRFGMDVLGGPRPPMHKPEIYASSVKAEGYVKPGVAAGIPAISAANYESMDRQARQSEPNVTVGRSL